MVNQHLWNVVYICVEISKSIYASKQNEAKVSFCIMCLCILFKSMNTLSGLGNPRKTNVKIWRYYDVWKFLIIRGGIHSKTICTVIKPELNICIDARTHERNQ